MAEATAEKSKAAKNGDAGKLVTAISIENLRDLMQEVGYRVELVKDGQVSLLRSATNGLAFDVRPGNLLGTDQHADFAFVALFAVRGNLPLDLLNEWNRTHRFGRLFLDNPAPDQTFLVFCMDVSVAGGVQEQQVRTQIGLWDALIQQLVPWLREQISKIAPTIDTSSAEPPAGTEKTVN